MRPAREVLHELFPRNLAEELLSKKRGRPTVASPKKATNIRFGADLLEAFKATGKGWQTRMDSALRDWLKTHSPALW